MSTSMRYLEHMRTYYGRRVEAHTALAFALRTVDREAARDAVKVARHFETMWDLTIEQILNLEEREAA